MIASTERGLLVTCLWYIREVDPQTLLLTGLTRDGVYLVEDGEVAGVVNNFRFNETPVGMLSRLAEVGATTRTLPREWGDYFTRCRDAAAADRGVQHVLGQPGKLTAPGRSPDAPKRATVESMRVGHHSSSQQVHMVTQARRSMSEDITARQRRYLLMMAIRTVCFVIAMVLFLNHLGG